MENYLLLCTIALITIGITAALVTLSFRRFQIAVFFLVLAPWVSTLFNSSVTIGSDYVVTVGEILRIYLVTIFGLTGFIKFAQINRAEKVKIPIQIKMLAVFIILALISGIYSVDYLHTFITAATFIALFGFLLGLYSWLMVGERFELVLNSIFLAVVHIITTNFFTLLFLNKEVWWMLNPNRFVGLWNHPEILGSVCLMTYPILLWKYFTRNTLRKGFVLVLIIMTGVMHVLSCSVSTMLISTIGIAGWYILKYRKVMLHYIVLAIGLAVALTLTAETIKYSGLNNFEKSVQENFIKSSELVKDELSSKSELPFFGYGFDAETNLQSPSSDRQLKNIIRYGSYGLGLNSGYYNVFLGLGVIGLLIWCFLLVIPLGKCLHLIPGNYAALFITALSMCLVLNFIDPAINIVTGPAGVLFWIVWIMAGRATNLEQKYFPHPRPVIAYERVD